VYYETTGNTNWSKRQQRGQLLTVSCLIESILLQVGTRKRTIGEEAADSSASLHWMRNESAVGESYDTKPSSHSVLRFHSAISTKDGSSRLINECDKEESTRSESSRLSFVIRKEKEASNVISLNDQLEDSKLRRMTLVGGGYQ